MILGRLLSLSGLCILQWDILSPFWDLCGIPASCEMLTEFILWTFTVRKCCWSALSSKKILSQGSHRYLCTRFEWRFREAAFWNTLLHSWHVRLVLDPVGLIGWWFDILILSWHVFVEFDWGELRSSSNDLLYEMVVLCQWVTFDTCHEMRRSRWSTNKVGME